MFLIPHVLYAFEPAHVLFAMSRASLSGYAGAVLFCMVMLLNDSTGSTDGTLASTKSNSATPLSLRSPT